MTATVVALAPVVAGFVAGHLLRRCGVASARDGNVLMVLNLYVCMPALVLRSLAEVDLTGDLLLFPAAAAVMVAVGYAAGRLLARGSGRLAADRAVVVPALMVVNSAFALPFVDAVYSSAGVARLLMFDVVNNVLVLTVVRAIAASGNPSRATGRYALHRVVRSPPIYAVAAGLLLNVTSWSIPGSAVPVVDMFAAASPFLIMVGTGLLFNPERGPLRRAATVATFKFGCGAGVTLALTTALGLGGVDRGVLLLLGMAPVGFIVVTYAALEDLDVDLAAQALTLSMALSFVLSVSLTGLLA